MKKTIFGNRKKCSQIRPNGQKLVKKLVLEGCPHFPATPQNVIANNDAGGNSHILVTTGRRVMVYSSKSAETPCSYLG